MIDAAREHGKAEGYEAEVTDLGDVLHAAWRLLTPEQRTQLLRSDEVENLLECGLGDAGEDYQIGEPEDGPAATYS